MEAICSMASEAHNIGETATAALKLGSTESHKVTESTHIQLHILGSSRVKSNGHSCILCGCCLPLFYWL